MDWDRVYRRNREALLGFLALVVAGLGAAASGSVERIPVSVHRRALALMIPLDAAVRRLVVFLARALSAPAPGSRPFPAGGVPVSADGVSARAPVFQLFDIRKSFAPRREGPPRIPPRITFFDGLDPPREAIRPRPEGVRAAPLLRRIEAVRRALDDLPGQARRLARWRARRAAARAAGKAVRFLEPLRPGLPPGQRKFRREAVHEVLADCDTLARIDVRAPG